MPVGTVLQTIAAIGIIVGTLVYVYKTWRQENTNIDDETIKRLNNAIAALEKENQYLRNENDTLKKQLSMMQNQIDQSKEDINRLRDLATNQTAINEVKGLLQKFEFIIPMMAQFTEADARHDKAIAEVRELLIGLGRETREMIREDRRTTQRVERRMLETPAMESADSARVSVAVKKGTH